MASFSFLLVSLLSKSTIIIPIILLSQAVGTPEYSPLFDKTVLNGYTSSVEVFRNNEVVAPRVFNDIYRRGSTENEDHR